MYMLEVFCSVKIVGSKELVSTISENANIIMPVPRLKVKLRSCGRVVSAMYTSATRALVSVIPIISMLEILLMALGGRTR